MVVTKEVEIGGKILSLETGRFAKQSSGAVMVRFGDTMVLVTAVASESEREDIDFFPLSCEYRERASAAGKIPGGFFKREGRPSEKEILSARLMDRPIRPLFPDGYKNDTQVAAFVYSYDGENDADVLGAIGASAALTISSIPFLEPIGEVRVTRLNGEFIVNPTEQQIKDGDMELVVAGTENSIMMVEGEAKEVSEDDLLKSLEFAHDAIKKIVKLQIELREACGLPKMEFAKKEVNEELKKDIYELAEAKMTELVSSVLAKEERAQSNKDLTVTVLEQLAEKYPEQEKAIKEIMHDLEKDLMRKRVLEGGLRLDGRKTTEIRPITIDLGVLPRVHGSALFTRGETQSLTSLTLGTKRDEQIIDGLSEEYRKRFILHYNFPPFSVGEVGRYTGTGRREIGHGNLAERALKNIVPDPEQFPYILRLNSDILESNGSSSMATVCAGSLSLMDGGVPVKCGIAGIAMGLIKEDDKFVILSDILGNEDHLGDMDFKVAGSSEGITAFQMDIKIQGISYEIIQQALKQAKDGRLHILGKMNEAISESRPSISEYAPMLISTKINPEKIGTVIGPGGKVIQKIQKEYLVDINIEEDGTVSIAGQDAALAKKAKEFIKLLVSVPEVGKVYNGKVMKIESFGAFVEIIPNTQGLLHISQVDTKRIKSVDEVLKVGDMVKVKLLKIENGKFSLSRKVLLENNDDKKDDTNKEDAD